MINKIGIIIPYFGRFPAYFKHFLAGCKYNTFIDWFIINDTEKPAIIADNIHFTNLKLDDFNKLAGKKLGFPLEVQNQYKLCDLKPAYGLIFEDYLINYDYWGYCDIDLILGEMGQFLPIDKIMNYDIVSTYKGFLSGPFCLYKNTDTVKKLFTQNLLYKSIFQDPEYASFDENIQRMAISGVSILKIFYLILFVFSSLFKFRFYSFTLREFRYQFQWFVKRRTISETYPVDITEIAFIKCRNKEIKVFTKELLYSDSYYKRINRMTWRIRWKDGILRDLDKNRQIFGFHFREGKNNPGFIIQECTGSFTITEKGIFNNE